MSGCSINRKENQQYKELYEGLFGEYNTRYVWEKNGELPLDKTRIGGEIVDSQLYNDVLESEYANGDVNEALRIMARTFSTDFQSQYLPNEDGQYTIDQVTDFISNNIAKKNRLREKKLAEINTPSSYTINFPEATLGGEPTGVFFTREEGLQIFKTLEFYGANLNNWTKVKQAFEEVAEELKLKLQEGNGRQGDESRLVNLFIILENFEMFKDWYGTQQDKVSIEVEDPEIQDSVTALTKDKDVSQQKRASKKVVKLVASLPAYREVYPNEINPETNEPYKRGTRVLMINDVLGLPMSGNFANNWNTLTNNLSGIQRYEDMYNKIKDLAKSRPEFKLLEEQLVDPTQALGTIDGGKFVTAMAFRSIMSNPDIKHFVVNQQRKDGVAIVTVQQKGRRNLRNPIATYDRTYFAYQDEKYVTTDTDGVKHVNLDRIVQDFEPLFRDLGQFLGKGIADYLSATRMPGTAEEKDNKLFFTNSRIDAMNQFVKSIGLGLTNGEFELPSNREKVREFYSQDNVSKGLKAIFEKLKIVNGLNKLSAEGETIRIDNILDFIFNPVKEILGDVNKVPKEVLEKVGLLGEQGYIGWAKGTTQEQIKKRDNNTKNYLGKKQTELAPLLEFFDSFETEFNSGSYLTAENKKKFSRNSWFYLTQITSGVNNANNYEELINTPGFERFDYRKNPDIIGSIWLNRIFGLPLNRQEIEKKPLSSYKKQRTTSGIKAGLDIIDFGGMEVKSQSGNRGFHTTNLHPDDKVMQDVFSFFQTGFMENIRFGDKTSSFATMANDPIISNRVYIPFNYDMIANPVKDLAVEKELVSIFTNYLGSEVKRIQTIIEEKQAGVPESTYQKFGKRLFIFKEILPAEIYDKLVSAENLDDLIKAYGEAKLALPEGLKTYFDKQTDRLVERIVDIYTHDVNLETGDPLSFDKRLISTANILNAHNFVNPQLLPADVRKEIREKKNNKIDINADSLRYLAAYYIKNGFIHNVEFLKFFVGDIANFDKIADNFREVFKRIPFTSTPGNPPVWSPIVEAFFENDVNRDALSVEISGIERKFTDKVRTVIYEDVKTFTKEDWDTYVDAYFAEKGWEELGIKEEDFEAYVDNPKEADGQGVVTLDFYRNYLISIGRWDWDIQEAAFNQQVTLVQKINEYNRTGNPELAKEISQLQTNMSAPFPPLKLGYFGPIVEDVKRNALHKFSLVPLIPSAIQGTQMMEQLNLMYNNQIDYYTFKSGSKMGNFGKAANFYVEQEVNGEKLLVPNPEIGEQNVTTLFIQNLREQQYQAPKFKGESTLSTQMIKLLFGDFFEFGDVNSSLSESTQDKIPGLYQKFSQRIKNIVAFEQLKLERKLGITRNAAGTIVSVDQMQMARYLTSELDKKDGSELLRKYIQVDANGKFINPLDAINQREKIEQIILSVINNKIIKQKLNGESYIQVAGTGFETKRFSKPTAQQLKDYGAADLKFYELDEDGNNQPMEVKVGFNPKKHSGLLELKFNGVKIETLAKLNDILKGDTPAKKDWIKANKEKVTMVGVRIPVQGPQSMEYVQVKEFLPSSAGPIMILPAQIVTKSGGDYDIDKLTFFETAIDEEGNIVQSNVSVRDYEQALSNQKELQSRKIKLKNLSEAVEKEVSANPSYQDREVLRKELKEISKSINEAIANIDEYLDNPDSIYSGNFTSKELIREFKGDIYQKVAALASFDAANNLTKQIDFLKAIGKEIKKITEESKELSSIFSYKKSLTNELVDVMREMMSLPEWFGKSTAPNNNDVMEQYTPPSSKLSSTDVFNPLTSWQIYSENILAKDALGIDAKINTMQKEFQLAGLRYTSPFLNAYYFKANRNKDREILLGGTTDADGNHKISKVLSEFINGHVDIAKEDWIILLGLDEETSPLAHTMILAGTPVKDVLDFIKSDVIVTVRKMSNKSELFKDQYSSTSAAKSYVFKPKGAILKLVYAKLRQSTDPSIISLRNAVEEIIAKELVKNKGKVSDTFKLSTYVNVLLKSNEFSKYIENFDPNEKLDEQTKLIRDIAYLLQFGVIQRQQERLRELTSNADFNTDNIRTSYTSSIREKKKSELKNDFNDEAIDFMFKGSALSGFNSNGFTQEIMQTVFPITDSDTVNDAIGVYLKKYEIFKDADVLKAVTRFKNNLTFGLAQLTASNENGKLLDYYRGENGLFVRSNPNNMKVRFEQLIKDFPHLKNNYLFSNLYVVDPNTSNYGNVAADSSREITFKVKNIDTDDSDVEYNDAFEEGLNHDNPVIREFFRDLALGSFMQFGPHFESGSVASIVPPSVYVEYTTQAYNKLEEMSKDEIAFEEYLSLTRFNTEFTRIFNSVFSLSPSFVLANYSELAMINPWVNSTLKAAVTLESKVLSETPRVTYISEVVSSPRILKNENGLIIAENVIPKQETIKIVQESKDFIQETSFKQTGGAVSWGYGKQWIRINAMTPKQREGLVIGKQLNGMEITQAMKEDFIKTGNTKGFPLYGYTTFDKNGNELPPIPESIVSYLMSLGIDVSQYDASYNSVYDKADNGSLIIHQDNTETNTSPIITISLGRPMKFVTYELNDSNDFNVADSNNTAFRIAVNAVRGEALKLDLVPASAKDAKGNIKYGHLTPDTLLKYAEEIDKRQGTELKQFVVDKLKEQFKDAEKTEYSLKNGAVLVFSGNNRNVLHEIVFDQETNNQPMESGFPALTVNKAFKGLGQKDQMVTTSDYRVVLTLRKVEGPTLENVVNESKLIESLSEQVTTGQITNVDKELKVNPLISAGVKPTDMYGNAAKDIQMADESTQFIGFQSGTATVSSTNKYREAWGIKANTGVYTANDVVMVSGSGTFRGVTAEQIKQTLTEQYKPLLNAAIAAGASFRVGNQYAKGNLSDQLIAEYLQKNGYVEEKLDGYSRWSEPTQPTNVSKFTGEMTYSYGTQKRSDVTADTTFDAILNGERTASTRFESQGNIDYWKKAKVGDIITWKSGDGRTVDVVVTKPLHKLVGSGKTPEIWSKLEGWSISRFNTNVKPKLSEAWQIEFKLVQPSTQISSTAVSPETKINIYAGTNENSELSNFAERPVTIGNETFRTPEGGYQAMKLLFTNAALLGAPWSKENIEIFEKLKTATGPEAKALGRKITDLSTATWDRDSSGVMKNVLLLSFQQNPDALARLLDTGNATLTHTQDKTKWQTEFPRLLMEVREELRGTQINPNQGDIDNLTDIDPCN